jgi:hypothetical protein
MSGPTINEIAQDIYTRAKAKGVDPNFALGLALREGLNKNTIGSSTFGNRDAKGYSYGPWQLYSGSPVAGAVASGGQAAAFMRQYGQRPSAANWREQNDFAISLMSRLTPQQRATTWYAIRDNGGPNALASIGLRNAMQMGLTPGGSPVGVAAPLSSPAGAATPSTDSVATAFTDTPAPPPPPPEDASPAPDLAEAAPDYAPPEGGMTMAAAEMPMDDMPASDATLGLSQGIQQKASMGRQRRADMDTPLGQIFNVGTFGKRA